MTFWTHSSLRLPGQAEDMLGPISDTKGPVRPMADLPPPAVQKPPSFLRNPPSILATLTSKWQGFRQGHREGSGIPLESSILPGETEDWQCIQRVVEECRGVVIPDDQMIVDEVVVDRSWSDDFGASIPSEGDANSISYHSGYQHTTPPTSVHERFRPSLNLCQPFSVLWDHICLYLMEFFSSRFPDPKLEADHQKEVWGQSKRLALWASTFFIANWVLGVAFIQGPVVLSDKIFYYGIAPALTFPIIIFCAFDYPRDHATIYQTFLCVSVWSWPFYQVIFFVMCGLYKPSYAIFTCGTKDFMSTFYYSSALQTIALFGAGMKRLSTLIGACTFLIFCFVLPTRAIWTRNILDFIVYQGVLMYIHYRRENSSRRLYTLRMQLNLQFDRTRRAQINERRAADSKRRLTSYVFHEVRVPLNTALLAVQNMEASGSVDKDQAIEFSALEGSLSMMSKVLNDVLDFNRMDSGRLESVFQPYMFHQVMQSMFIPLQLATNARGLELVINLDTNIDKVARLAAYQFQGYSQEEIQHKLKDNPSGESSWGVVVGDEIRLRQIITNLASNACKFTPAGGKLTISTHLILPVLYSRASTEAQEFSTEPSQKLNTPSTERLSLIEQDITSIVERIVVRIEVSDTGWGIRPQDMVHSRLFSAFNQTEQGRLQGGKGTGLGLALVRQIVKLSGGRLGVRSKLGEGSTFWVELPLGVGCKAAVSVAPPTTSNTNSTTQLEQMFDVPAMPLVPSDSTNDMTDSVNPNVFRRSASTRTRSSSALHSIMDQVGSVELVLSRFDSGSLVPTRTIEDFSTGTEYPPDQETGSNGPHGEFPRPFVLEKETSSDTLRHPHQHPSETPALTSTKHPSLRTIPPKSPTLLDNNLPVLVVDDDPLTRMLMKRMLTRMGCTVSTAENGEIAMAMVVGSAPKSPVGDTPGPTSEQPTLNPQYPYSVVFMDNQMPVMSGLNAIKKLRDLGRQDFVVGVTGNALLDDQNEYLEAGVNYVLTKPVLERNLKRMLVIAMERSVDLQATLNCRGYILHG
ncbi:hypothetical protein BDZ94DRAFT_249341 [Collybia nuda]|uniref:histidine kinase n=1 Tax=Collybia nuda TaxID=64659 RepID=A0A9P5YCH3_9AGAR|nr:hypothetical protein BDZ94DRAFT_249341 [Collybia nuda]